MQPLLKETWILLNMLLWVSCLSAQPIPRDTVFTFSHSGVQRQINMEGTLDGSNTFTYPATTTFQPMVRMRITNRSDTTLVHPRIIFNDQKRWFDIESMAAECFEGAVTDKEKALALWQFIRNNRIHRYEPQCCSEINDPIKLFGVYGYGMCYNTNYANAFIAQQLNATYRSFSFRNGRHFASGIKFSDRYILIDGDLETFYLTSDNTTLANYEDLVADRSLIKRTHHYGKSSPYNQYNTFIATSIYLPFEPMSNFGRYKNFHTLDVSLRPHEAIEYSWSPGKMSHYYDVVPNVEPEDIANGRLLYATNFLNAPLENLVDTISGVVVNSGGSPGPNLHSGNAGMTGSFVLVIRSPFVILNGKVKGSFIRNNPNDSLAISFSKDSLNWHTLWSPTHVGMFTDSLELRDHVATTSSPAIYTYYLKFAMTPAEEASSCGIDSLHIVTDFQVSRSFLPSLKVGTNTVAYSHKNAGTMNTEVFVEWKESSENMPPEAVQIPEFPADGAQVDGLRFTFKWKDFLDTEDYIADYEFKLSDRMDMRFPLSPSFEMYTSAASASFRLNEFTIPYDGMLNSGTTYYWQVRAKDSRGAWSNWSPVWSFTPFGPMPPVSGKADVEGDSILLSWDRNPSGTTPQHYEVHGSQERLGFTADSATLLYKTKMSQFKIPTKGINTPLYYRVIAVDHNGSRSGASSVIHVPYPYLYSPVDTLRPTHPYTLSLVTPKARVHDMYQLFPGTFGSWYLEDDVDVEIISKPDWLVFDAPAKALVGSPDYRTAHSESDSIVIKWTSGFDGTSTLQTIRIPIHPNRHPALSSIDTLAVATEPFEQTIMVLDPDFESGDHLTKVEFPVKPSWLTVTADHESNAIYLSGVPDYLDAGDTILVVSVTDALGQTTVRTFNLSIQEKDEKVVPIQVYPNPFSLASTIRLEVETDGEVRLEILNMHGEVVELLQDNHMDAGIHRLTWIPNPGKPGVYLIRMTCRRGGSIIRTHYRKVVYNP